MTGTPETDAVHIGYQEPFFEIEYGVFIDRREAGLGFTLLTTTRSWDHVVRVRGTIHRHPTVVRSRQVTYTPWEQRETTDPCLAGGTHEPLAAGDARDGGSVHCFKCQVVIRPGEPS